MLLAILVTVDCSNRSDPIIHRKLTKSSNGVLQDVNLMHQHHARPRTWLFNSLHWTLLRFCNWFMPKKFAHFVNRPGPSARCQSSSQSMCTTTTHWLLPVMVAVHSHSSSIFITSFLGSLVFTLKILLTWLKNLMNINKVLY